MREVPARLEALAATGGLERAALHSQLAAAVQVVLHMRRRPDGVRVLDVVGVPVREAATVVVRPAWSAAGGWGEARQLLGELLTERGVTPPW